MYEGRGWEGVGVGGVCVTVLGSFLTLSASVLDTCMFMDSGGVQTY